MALSIGLVTSLIMLLITLLLMKLGAFELGQKVALLGQYFYGYTLSTKGAIVGMLYGFFWGFVFGWLLAYLRNLLMGVFWRRAVVDSRLARNTSLLDLI